MADSNHGARADYLDKSAPPALELRTSMDDPLATRAPLVQRPLPLTLPRAGAAADQAAAARVVDRYRQSRAAETIRRQDADLACWSTYLADAGVTVGDPCDPAQWAGVSWGLVEGFVQWQLQAGYAIGSVNVRLSTVKTYAKLATKAGALDAAAYALIHLVAGFRGAEGRRVDARRTTTRIGAKKATPVSISSDQARALKDQAEALDGLLMCLLLDHGLRVGEVALLRAADFDDRGILSFYRPKVAKQQRHRLTADTRAALAPWRDQLPSDHDDVQIMWNGVRTIRQRVGELGARVGLPTLSPHDCRHYWATAATRAGTSVKALQDAGGWSSPAMPLRYAESAEIANEGVRLDE